MKTWRDIGLPRRAYGYVVLSLQFSPIPFYAKMTIREILVWYNSSGGSVKVLPEYLDFILDSLLPAPAD
jgi:hypothetical protein